MMTNIVIEPSITVFSLLSLQKPQRQRSVSMEDYDKPNIRRLSITSKD
jgi:hypothetical protein